MIDELLSPFAPHLCCSCGKIGTLLCESCKYYIIHEQFSGCCNCDRSASINGLCGHCRPPYQRAWVTGWREGPLLTLIDRYKFQRAKAGHKAAADLLLETLPELPPETIVVPIPTVRAHIRVRGYDHTFLIAQQIAMHRHLRLSPVLRRITTTQQKGNDATERAKQAKIAYRVEEKLNPTIPYLLVDDVVTTGATLRYGAKALHRAGARTIWVTAVAKQPLD